uniref:PPM-type phosphatase domain-containing protein n=1 Tax=Dunaliella tertiolecta TaxID=3047 RepID=A0A7S3QPN3_DUNTE
MAHCICSPLPCLPHSRLLAWCVQIFLRQVSEQPFEADEWMRQHLHLQQCVLCLPCICSNSLTQTGAAIKVDEAAPEPDDNMVQAGCTAVVAIKCGDKLYVANAGDSRGVLCRGSTAVPLSEDHKPASERERSRIIAAGGFLSEIGGVCRVNGNLNLSRAIGDLKYKSSTELPAKDQIITAEPDICQITLTPEDRFFVLACDGIWDVMSNQDVVDFVSQKLDMGMSPSQTASALLDACLANDPKVWTMCFFAALKHNKQVLGACIAKDLRVLNQALCAV